MSPTTQPSWFSLQRRPWPQKTSFGVGPPTVCSKLSPESGFGPSWLMWGQCWGQMMTKRNQRRPRDWCPPSPPAIRLPGPWCKDGNEQTGRWKVKKKKNKRMKMRWWREKQQPWMMGKEMNVFGKVGVDEKRNGSRRYVFTLLLAKSFSLFSPVSQ